MHENLFITNSELKVSTESSPHVNLYQLEDELGKAAFISSLRTHALGQGHDNQRFLLWRIGNDVPQMLARALELRFLVDEYPLQLIDHAKLRKDNDDEIRRRIISDSSFLDSSVIAEFSWLNEGRFVSILPYDQMREIVFSRNKGIFTKDAYERLRTTKIAIIGAGVGFSIAEVLMWLGAENLTVIDGGTVAPHDTQRLPSSGVHSYGLNHATHFLQRALDFFPYGNYKAYSQNLGLEDASDTVSLHKVLEWVGLEGIVLEEIDQLYLKGIIREKSNSPVFMGTDISLAGANQIHFPGSTLFGGRLTPDDMVMLEEMYYQGKELPQNIKTIIAGKMIGHFMTHDFQSAVGAVVADGHNFWPQSGIAARLSSAIVGAAIMEYLEGSDIKDEVMIDLRTSVRK